MNTVPRQTHHTESAWTLASSIPAGKKKSVVDCWNGYHSVPVAEEDRSLTRFITPWGAYEYCTMPQGFIAAQDNYTDRTARIVKDVPRLKKCVDDCLLFDDTIEENFSRMCDFLSLCSSHGIIFNPKKFQFAEDTVKFVGFKVTDTGIQPTDEFVDNIMSFPTPKSLTDIRSWFGAVAQISYAFSSAPIMQPFRHLLSSKVPFSWSPDLDEAFQASKLEIIRQCEEGVRTFDPNLPTALATDWCRWGIGFWLTQKRCTCVGDRPGCCVSGWQTVFVGSRFCSPAESRYAPIEGEGLAAAWGVDKCKFFLLGMPTFKLCLDHKPLICTFGTQELSAITNQRLFSYKTKLMLYRFSPVHIPGKKHVTADCFSRRSDNPIQDMDKPTSTPLITDISNVQPGYADHLGPPSWVSGPNNSAPHCSVASLLDQPDQENMGMFHGLRQQPSTAEMVEAEEIEQMVVGVAIAALSALDIPIYCVCSLSTCPRKAHQLIQSITWPRLETAAQKSSAYQLLRNLVTSEDIEDKSSWPPELLNFYQHRHLLVPVGPVLLYHDRPVIPVDLRLEVMEHLHAGHQGVSQMYARAAASIFWPGMREDIAQFRAACQHCTYVAPSNPAPPPCEPEQPSFPFSSICADFFSTDSGTYLSIVDRYSGWLSIFCLKRDDSAHVIEVLREYTARWGIPDILTSDGASVFTSQLMKDFLRRWGIQHRVSSPYYPRANKRAELGVKSAKRLLLGNVGPNGSLNTDRLARALLLHRNCPDPLTGLSPAQVLLGRQLRDHLPNHPTRYQPRAEWRLEADMREKAFAKRHAKMSDR